VPGSGVGSRAGEASVCRPEEACHWVAARPLGVRGWERGLCWGVASSSVDCQKRVAVPMTRGSNSRFQGLPDGLLPGSVDGVVCMGGG
jgi:hypothetical protein